MNAYPPMISPRFQVAAGVLQYKPYPSYPSWLDAWDVGGLVPADIQPQIDAIVADIVALTIRVTDVEAAVITAQSTANTAITNAATALAAANEADDTADAAQATANTAITNAAAALAAANEADDTADAAQSTANTALANAATALAAANEADDTADAAQSTANTALALAGSGGGARRATLWMDEAHYINGTPTTLIGDAYLGNFVRYTTTNLAEFTFSFVSGALNDGGLYLLCSKGATSGIVEVRIDGTLVGTVDLYNATTLNNQFGLIGFGFGNPTFTAGYHKLSVKVNGKHASSSGWAAAFTKISIRTNAD